MATVNPDVGTGTTISMTGTFAANVLAINWSGWTRGAIDTTYMLTATACTFKPTDLYDPGELSVDIQLKTDEKPPITDVPGNVTITFPDAETWIAEGFATGFEFADPLEDLITGTLTIKLSGAVT